MQISKAISLVSLLAVLAFTSCETAEEWRDCLDRCAAVPEVGDCDAAFPKYYWDPVDKTCKEFTWGGCGGTVPFHTLEACEQCRCS